jgi:hypothetical protein
MTRAPFPRHDTRPDAAVRLSRELGDMVDKAAREAKPPLSRAQLVGHLVRLGLRQWDQWEKERMKR